MKVAIIGAGMAGLIAARWLSYRGHEVAVFEKQPSLPNNHHALLRFRSDVVGNAVGIQFEPVDVIKTVHSWRNPVADLNAYSRKATGQYSFRSIASATGTKERRFIAPPDFINQLYEKLGPIFAFDCELTPKEGHEIADAVISTIPLGSAIKQAENQGHSGFDLKPSDFLTRPGTVLKAVVPNSNVCASVYVPDPSLWFYRVSLTGKDMIVEIGYRLDEEKIGIDVIIDQAANVLGVNSSDVRERRCFDQPYAKIVGVDERKRKQTIMDLTRKTGVYSLGRFATWRPGLMNDDLIKDLTIIEKMMSGDKQPQYNASKEL